MALDDLLTVRDVARLSKLSEKTVRRSLGSGALRASKLCGRWRIRLSDFEEWVGRSTFVPDARPKFEPVPVPPPQGSRAALREIESEAA